MVSGEGRWWGGGLTCSCAPNDNDVGGLTCSCVPNDNDVVVIVLLSTAGPYGGKGEDPRGGSGDGEW